MKSYRIPLALSGRGILPMLLTVLAVPLAHAQYVINGAPYKLSQPTESLTATFTAPDGGISTSSYSGYVLVNVTGVGQSYSNVFNDAFYLYTNQFANTIPNGHDGGYYQLTFDTKTLVNNNLSRNAKNFIYGGLPAYNPLHNYTFILNTGLSNAAQLHFGVSDAGYSDNTGAYTINVTQLAMTPEPSAWMTALAGLIAGVSSFASRRRRRVNN